MDVRKIDGSKAELIPGMWYVGVEVKADAPMIPTANWHWGCGEIAQYVGEGEFYDEGMDQPTEMRNYDYIVEQHMGKLS